MNVPNAVVRQELVSYPRGERGSAWRYFRAIYAPLRLNSLGRQPEIQDSPEVVHQEAVRLVRRWFPDFEGSVSGGAA
jgi:hypothetical protein